MRSIFFGPRFQEVVVQQLVLALSLSDELESSCSGAVQAPSLKIVANVELGVEV